MIRNQQPAVVLFVIGMVSLGVLSVIYHDFAYSWQPVPASVPGRGTLAVLSGLLMIGASLALLIRATEAIAIRILFSFLILWQLLKVPALIAAPGMEAVWLGFGEIAVLLAGGWILFAQFSNLDNSAFFRHITGERGIRLARILFGVALVPIGLSHIVYVGITVSFCSVMVTLSHWLGLPDWLRTDGLRSGCSVFCLTACGSND